jgi:hypothetical protein
LQTANAILDLYQKWAPATIAAFAAQAPRSATLLVPNATHYVFSSGQPQVAAALRAFFPDRLLREPAAP